MSASLPFGELCCVARATLLNLCVDDADLRALGLWSDAPHPSGHSPAVLGRARLAAAAVHDPALARAMRDRLDLAALDTLLTVRELPAEELEQTVELFLEQPDGRALPALLWALCSDERDDVRALGVRLCHEALTLACRQLAAVDPASARP